MAKDYYRRCPNPMGSYGGRFAASAESSSHEPYYCFGNGSAMWVSPVGFACESLEVYFKKPIAALPSRTIIQKASKAHRQWRQFLARTGQSKTELKAYLEAQFGYDLDR